VFDDKSRYKDLPLKSFVETDGSERRYVARRFLPAPETLSTLGTVKVTDSDRLDLIAAARLGEPSAFWRIAAANAAVDPHDLLTPTGRTLRLPNPI
jgi:hypothetical protein